MSQLYFDMMKWSTVTRPRALPCISPGSRHGARSRLQSCSAAHPPMQDAAAGTEAGTTADTRTGPRGRDKGRPVNLLLPELSRQQPRPRLWRPQLRSVMIIANFASSWPHNNQVHQLPIIIVFNCSRRTESY